MSATALAYGGNSSTAPLRAVLVQRPGTAFGAAYDDPRHGFRHPVDLPLAQREHDAFTDLLTRLGVRVHQLDADAGGPDLVYTYDPMMLTDAGTISLRPGKPTRSGEPAIMEAWTRAAGIPVAGRIDEPGSIEGGDAVWLRTGLLCIGRSLRTNDAGARQLATLVGGDCRTFDLPYWRGPDELVHLMSVISPVSDNLAVVFQPLLPVGLWQLLDELSVRTVTVPEEEFGTLGCNVLAVRPGVVVVADGNPRTRRALEASGCEVHAYPAQEIGLNGSGGPTCMTRPLRRDA